ncbi:MAG: molybdenum cofactor guanylyltransferase MobA [Pseudomonadota bacterium]
MVLTNGKFKQRNQMSVIKSEMKDPYQDISAVILAGGQARRLGGVDKGLVKLCGKPLILHVMNTLCGHIDKILISANRHLSQYTALQPHTVIPDNYGEYAGPLAGILSAMQQCPTPLLLVTPCDAPMLPAELVPRLYQAFCAQQADICIVHDGERLQPLFALMKCDLQKKLEIWLKNGGRKVLDWYQTNEISTVDFSDMPDRFRNLNTWAALDELAKQLQNPEIT